MPAARAYKRNTYGDSGYRPRGASGFKRRSPSAPGYTRRSGYYGRYTVGNQKRRARQGLQIEKKFFDTTHTFTFDNTGEVPATGQLCLIPQGTTESTRVGRKCQLKSIQTRLSLTYNPSADTVGNTSVYLLLVMDKQCNGAAAAVTDVLTSNDLSTAMINMANSERFKILKRWSYVMQSGAGVQAAYGRDSKIVDFYTKCNIPLEFSSTTGAITEVKSNNLFLLAGTNGLGDDLTTCAGTTRLRYTDL